MSKRVFLSFLDENEVKREGYFTVIEETSNFIKIETGKNIVTIPYARILKIKEAKE